MFTRKFWFALVCLAAAAAAAPTLSTIQDTLYKADGTRFSGTLTISWESFEGPNTSAIVKQSTTVKVTDGFLKVQLVPTATSVPPVLYKVTYNSDGRVQFYETWNVPAGAQPLRVRDVRVASQTSAPEITGPVQESDVTGLVGDLAARPVKGPGYAAGRVAMVSDTGLLESVTGSPSDCVRVDGSAGPCGGGSSSMAFVEGDTPAGIVDGANTTFTLSEVPEPVGSVAVFRNGLRQKAGLDYQVSGATLQFVAAAVPQPGDTLLASYRIPDGSQGGEPQVYSSSQVICSGIGGTVTSTTTVSLASCALPAAALLPGDRLEIRFDLEHQGTAGGFTFEVGWGNAVVLSRTASASDNMATGRVDVSILASGAQYSSQSWGSVLALATGLGQSSQDLSGGLTLTFQGSVAESGDSVTLRNFTVTRLP